MLLSLTLTLTMITEVGGVTCLFYVWLFWSSIAEQAENRFGLKSKLILFNQFSFSLYNKYQTWEFKSLQKEIKPNSVIKINKKIAIPCKYAIKTNHWESPHGYFEQDVPLVWPETSAGYSRHPCRSKSVFVCIDIQIKVAAFNGVK